MYNNLEKMRIDEKQEKLDISDHNLLETFYTWESKNEWNKTKGIDIEYFWKINEQTMDKYLRELDDNLQTESIESVQVSTSIKILGVIVDEYLDWKQHIRL